MESVEQVKGLFQIIADSLGLAAGDTILEILAILVIGIVYVISSRKSRNLSIFSNKENANNVKKVEETLNAVTTSVDSLKPYAMQLMNVTNVQAEMKVGIEKVFALLPILTDMMALIGTNANIPSEIKEKLLGDVQKAKDVLTDRVSAEYANDQSAEALEETETIAEVKVEQTKEEEKEESEEISVAGIVDALEKE